MQEQRRIQQPAYRIPAYTDRNCRQGHPQRDGGDRFNPAMTVRMFGIRLAMGVLRCKQYEKVRGQIGKRMHPVRDQRL